MKKKILFADTTYDNIFNTAYVRLQTIVTEEVEKCLDMLTELGYVPLVVGNFEATNRKTPIDYNGSYTQYAWADILNWDSPKQFIEAIFNKDYVYSKLEREIVKKYMNLK